MPLDRRALRTQLQRSRGFEPPSREVRSGGSHAASTVVSFRWMSGDEAAVLQVGGFETVWHLRKKLQKLLDPEGPTWRLQMLSPEFGLLSDETTIDSLGCSKDVTTLQLVADRSSSWHRGVCGANVEISEDGQLAKRVASFYEAIVFCTSASRSCRIRVVSMDDCWSGNLELGFAALPPEELGFKAHTGNISTVNGSIGTSTSEPWHSYVTVGTVVHWELLADASIRVSLEGRDGAWILHPGSTRSKRKVHKAKDVYPFVGIYGMTQAIELVSSLQDGCGKDVTRSTAR